MIPTLPHATLSTLASGLAIAASLLFLAIGMRALLAPSGASRFYGIGLDDPAGFGFVQAMGARNIGLSLTAIALVALDLRPALIAILSAAALTAGLDAWIVISRSGIKGAKHAAYVAALGSFAIWLAATG